MRCLITGINGFAASHLAERLLASGHEVIGTARLRSSQKNIEGIKDKIKLLFCDFSDPFGIDGIIQSFRPEIVFHLAAQSFVGVSWTHPEETIKTNVLGTLYLLEACRKLSYRPRIHIASSSQVYGKIDEDNQPMTDRTLFNPMNPYDTSKLAQDMLALQYFNSYGLPIIRTRAFNITGPRRGSSFAESSWAKQIVEIERAGSGTIKHGNLESFRDYIDVRDVVIAYEWAAISGAPGQVYLLGSGNAVSMDAILKILCSLTKANVNLSQDPDRMRPSDTPYMRCGSTDLKRIVQDVEKRQLIPLAVSLYDLLDYWRNDESLSGKR